MAALKRAAPTALPEEVTQHHGGSFGTYMLHKVRKLDQQFQQHNETLESNVFKGIAVHVTGRTEPPLTEVKRLMGLHGGTYVHYYSSETVTHVVADNLPMSKRKEFMGTARPPPVVRAKWVVDSLAAGRVLPVGPYLLDAFRAGSTSLLDVIRKAAEPEAPLPMAPPSPSPAAAASSPAPAPPTLAPAQPAPASAALPEFKKYDPVGMKSTDTDPEFLASYFKSSRLHHIGSWRQVVQQIVEDELSKRAALVDASSQSQAVVDGGVVFGTVLDAGPELDAPASSRPRCIVHIDMDCFFASVALLDHPDLRDSPVCVSHTGGANSTGEISSANYHARKHGVRAGMFVNHARELCPELRVLPYNFPKIEATTRLLYQCLLQTTVKIQPVSCDEAILDLSDAADPDAVVTALRERIFATTGCTCSAGIAPNLLLAKIATGLAKPNGQRTLTLAEAPGLLAPMSVNELPGVGWKLSKRLASMHITLCSHICSQPVARLKSQFGDKTGQMLWDAAHGIDTRPLKLQSDRKSIGAEINWGVRFTSAASAEHFFHKLAEEVSSRMVVAGVMGHHVTLKIKQRQADAGKPGKLMGCGLCDSFTKSTVLPTATNDALILGQTAIRLWKQLPLGPVEELRGAGMQLTQLVPATSTGPKQLSLNFVPVAEADVDASTRTVPDTEPASPKPSSVLPEGTRPLLAVILTARARRAAVPPTTPSKAVPPPAPAKPTPPAKVVGPPGRPSPPAHQHRELYSQDLKPKATDIDASILAELPPSMQAELFGHVTSPARVAAPETGKAFKSQDLRPHWSQVDPSVLEALPPELLREIQGLSKAAGAVAVEPPRRAAAMPATRLFASHSWAETSPILTDWLCSVGEPSSGHVCLLCAVVMHYLLQRDAESVDLLVRLLSRQHAWDAAASQVASFAQQAAWDVLGCRVVFGQQT